ncbi:class A beta-lactamase-related serine hydrolase [Bacteroides sp. 214]|uniref:serine hydrolase domain-containing protein n=1 Tax=Bacteroides sp. 214 TaxID=2302935 RepID=UPI0013D40446|nr:serine hydrolase domain-containing protein [Bacteroides sp. 214]NDW13739.1 class A beta-lactamase-related serine hydrolase [Bacteroides sp. 214]
MKKTVIKKSGFFISLALMCSVLFSCAPSQKKQADKLMQEAITNLNAVGLSVAVVKDNQIVYTGAFGYKSLVDSILLSSDDIFRIASISKTFTGTAIMQLNEAGKFNLDDDVSDAFGILVRNPHYPDVSITYRMLLSHTSSLSDKMGYFTFDVIDPVASPEDYKKVYNETIPGSVYEYCNLGYNMLGALVEIHSGERFDKYIKAHILDPLGVNAGFNVDELDAKQFVSLYNYEQGSFIYSPDAYSSRSEALADYTMGRTTTVFSPTGGMKIAPKDLAKHMLIQINKGSFNGVTILNEPSVTTMQTPYMYGEKVFDYGLSIQTTDRLIPGEVMKGHTGSAYGLYSAMFFEPEKKFGFVMMTNGCPPKRGENKFLSIQSDVINALYEVFIK